MNLRQMQSEVREWSNRNFPNNEPWHPLMGIGEELGEIMHSYLKMSQGIRGTREEHLAKIADGIGDVVIYACDFASRKELKLNKINLIELSYKDRLQRIDFNYLLQSQVFYGKVVENFINFNTEIIPYLKGVLNHLSAFAVLLGIDMEQEIITTWEQVRQRDWNKAREENGGNLL